MVVFLCFSVVMLYDTIKTTYILKEGFLHILFVLIAYISIFKPRDLSSFPLFKSLYRNTIFLLL